MTYIYIKIFIVKLYMIATWSMLVLVRFDIQYSYMDMYMIISVYIYITFYMISEYDGMPKFLNTKYKI